MAHYTYIIYSKSFDLFYKGESANPHKRLVAHNTDANEFTSGKGPWELVCIEEFDNRSNALVREKAIKKLNRRSLEKLIVGNSNLLNEK